MPQVQLFDYATFDNEKVRITKDGYLIATPRIARTGIQEYLGSEVGRPDLEIVRVLRPAKTVFDKAALQSMAHKPITMGHPGDLVTADNWREHAIGDIGDEVLRDGEFIRVPVKLMDAEAVKQVRAGKVELSVGYTSDLRWDSGKTADGQEYDAIQENIRANHVAICDRARGGPMLRIGDTHSGENQMSGPNQTVLQQFTLDGVTVEMPALAIQLVQREIQKFKDSVAAITTDKDKLAGQVAELTTQVATLKTSVQGKDAEIATLKKQVEDSKLKPEQLDALLQERGNVQMKAAAFLGDAAPLAGKSDNDMRRMVVDKHLGDLAKGWTDEQVRISFQTITKDINPGQQHFRGALPQPGAGHNVNDAAAAIAANFRAMMDTRPQSADAAKAYNEYVARTTTAWDRSKDAAKAN